MTLTIQVSIALLAKHFFADYLFNPIIKPANKHIYGSLGSICHAGLHMFFAVAFLSFILPFNLAFMIALFDGFLHYHIDFIKSRILYMRKVLCRRFVTKIMFADQALHMSGYFLIIYFVQ